MVKSILERRRKILAFVWRAIISKQTLTSLYHARHTLVPEASLTGGACAAFTHSRQGAGFVNSKCDWLIQLYVKLKAHF